MEESDEYMPKGQNPESSMKGFQHQILGILNIKILNTVMNFSSMNFKKSIVHSYNRKGKRRTKEISLQKHSR